MPESQYLCIQLIYIIIGSNMVTFIIADNQELTRAGIESVIAGDDVRIFHAPDKAELIDLLKQHGDSVVILDYTLFDFTDVDNLLIVGERFCRSRWLLISDDLTAEFLKRIFYSSGQMGVVFKDQSLHIIREAINYTVSGNRYISQRAVVLLLNQQPEEPATRRGRAHLFAGWRARCHRRNARHHSGGRDAEVYHRRGRAAHRPSADVRCQDHELPHRACEAPRQL